MKAIVYASIGEYDEFRAMLPAGQRSLSRERQTLRHYRGRLRSRLCADELWQSRGGRKRPSEALSLSRENEVRLFLPLVLCALGNLYLQTGRAAEARGHPARGKGRSGSAWPAASTVLASVYLASAYAHLGKSYPRVGTSACLPGGSKAEGLSEPSRPWPFSPRPAFCLFKAPSAAADAIAQFERTIEIATRLEDQTLVGLGEGNIGPSVGQFGQEVRRTRVNSPRLSSCLRSRK